MFNIFNNLSTLYNAYKKKPQDLYSGPISSVYKPPVTNGAPRSQIVGGQSVSTTGSTKAPQSYPMPSVNKTTPPPSTPPPTVKPPVVQPTAQQTYEQKYNNYLAQSQARKEQLARQNEAEDKMRAQEEYDANKTALTASRGNLDTMMSGFRQRAATGQARLDTQAQQNRDRASVTAGENQRQLAIDRRDARNDNEKRYAALGTIDSMGTGSFQSANENTESDFLSLTAKNKQATQYAIQDIDNKLFEAKASSEERIATEESKYNDAILEIERLLAGNETGKAQAIRAASQLLQQKKAEIMDEYEGLRITSEKEKYDLQAKLEAAAMDEQKMRALFTEGLPNSASPEFIKTGQPTTAQDQFIIFKYPKEAEAYMKMLTDSKTLTNSGGTEVADTINLIDQVMDRPLDSVTGAMRIESNIPGTEGYGTQRLIQQIKDKLALAARGQLKGQGQISNFEAEMLRNAVTALDSKMSKEDFIDEMKKIKRLLEQKNGGQAQNTGGEVIVGPDGNQYQFTN